MKFIFFHPVRWIIGVLAGAAIWMLFGGAFSSTKAQDPAPAFAPSNDFSFIKPCYCISDLYSKEQWLNNKGRSFDKDGVHLTNDKKHPVNACHYALFCYDQYREKGDTA